MPLPSASECEPHTDKTNFIKHNRVLQDVIEKLTESLQETVSQNKLMKDANKLFDFNLIFYN